MILTIFGVTGVGKSYFTAKIVEKLNFKRIIILTTRKKRDGEIEGVDKYFITEEELDEKIKNGEIGYVFELLGSRYAYLKSYLESNENWVTEVHYTEIYGFKKACKDMKSVYLKPNNIKQVKQYLKQKNFTEEMMEKRLEEYKIFEEDKKLQSEFDYIFYNNYDLESEDKLISLVKSVIKGS